MSESEDIEPEWSRYQERSAELLRQMGWVAHTNQNITGARGTHMVDVQCVKKEMGLTQLWIVECKKTQRPVAKAQVATLAEIVQDVGADRGLLLCESGFQSGALRLAQHRNITLTSLEDLRENAAEEFSHAQLMQIIRSVPLLREKIMRGRYLDHIYLPSDPSTGPSHIQLLGQLSMLETGVMNGLAGLFPVLIPEDRDALIARDTKELTLYAMPNFTRIARLIDEFVDQSASSDGKRG